VHDDYEVVEAQVIVYRRPSDGRYLVEMWMPMEPDDQCVNQGQTYSYYIGPVKMPMPDIVIKDLTEEH